MLSLIRISVAKIDISKRNNSVWFSILILLQFVCMFATAQNKSITGHVRDGKTREGVGFATITVRGTNLGVVADSAGNFDIVVSSTPQIIEVSMLGYDRKAIEVSARDNGPLIIGLNPAGIELKDIVVKPGKKTRRIIDTAALFVLARVIDCKRVNNPETTRFYKLNEHTKLVVSLLNASPKFTKARIFRQYSFFFEKHDTTNAGEDYIPLGILEEYNRIYHSGEPLVDRKVIYYRHLSGFKEEFISNYLSDQFKSIDIYKNVFVMANKSFTSPFSPAGRAVYLYHILDTLREGNSVSYKINFVAKNKEDVALKGYAIIDSTTWGIKQIYFKPNEKANLNYLTDYSIEQKFNYVGNSWIMQTEKLSTQGNLLEQQHKMSFYLTKLTARDSIQLNHDMPETVFKAKEDIVMKDAYKKPRGFLDTIRIVPLDDAEQHIYHSFDTAITVKSFKKLQWAANLITTATFRAGPIDFGRAYYLVSRNAVEGYRVRLGAFTNDNFSRIFYLYGHAAYGFTDKKWKYEADAHIKLPSQNHRWNELWLQSKNDMIELGRNNPLLSYDNVLTLLSPSSKYNRVLHTSTQSIQYEKDWFKGFSMNLGASFNRYYSTERGFIFEKYQGEWQATPGFKTTELMLEFRYCANERYTEKYGYRYFLPSNKPSFSIKYTLGIKNPLTGDYNYHKLQASVQQIIYMPIVGYGKLNLSSGYISGNAPYPVAFISGANMGLFRDETAYQLTRQYEFAHDVYVSLWYEHHFEGLLFNHIPYVNKLKLREFLTAKVLWGDMSSSNKTLLRLPGEMNTASKIPYAEVGFGIENILKIIQVSFTWRADYRNVSGAQNFALKLAIKPSF